MNLLTLTLVSHLTVAHFKPVNLFKFLTRTQTVEAVVRPSLSQAELAIRRAA